MFSGKAYCINCYNELKIQNNARKELIDNVCKIFNTDVPSGLILKQIKEYHDQYQYNYAAINYTLWYIVCFLNKQLDEKYGLALIKYYYDEAKQYYEQQEKIKQSVSNVKIKTKTISKRQTNKTNKNNNIPLIDISKLIEGGDDN